MNIQADASDLHGAATIRRVADKRDKKEFVNLPDRLRGELLLNADKAFTYCTPHKYGEHRSVFTPFLVFLMAITYAFMAGAYLTEGDGDSPHALHKYIINNAQFDARFLTTWGALHGPETFHQVYRLITYGLLHQSSVHCLSNLVVITTFGVTMEHKFGFWRVAILWLVSTVGGGLFAISFGQACTVTVGCSGAIFGLVGLYIIDLFLHFKVFRFLWFLAIVCFLVAGNLSAANSTSSLAHVGGFICGMMPSLLFIPHLGHAVADAIGAALAIVGSLVLVPLLFSLAFSRALPGLTC